MNKSQILHELSNFPPKLLHVSQTSCFLFYFILFYFIFIRTLVKIWKRITIFKSLQLEIQEMWMGITLIIILAYKLIYGLVQSGGPSWAVPLGRRDGLTANRTLADTDIPNPFLTFEDLKANFSNQGLDSTDLVDLSGDLSELHVI